MFDVVSCSTAILGGLAERALLRQQDLYVVPANVSSHVCAGFELNYGTTWHGLKDIGKLEAGETLLVLGASGGVGAFFLTSQNQKL